MNPIKDATLIIQLSGVIGMPSALKRVRSMRDCRKGYFLDSLSKAVGRAQLACMEQSDPATYYDLISFAAGVAQSNEGAVDMLKKCIELGGVPKLGLE